MVMFQQPEERKTPQTSGEDRVVLSSGQAALRYHFEDLIRLQHAELPLRGHLAVRGAGLISKLAVSARLDTVQPEAVILAGGMTDGRPAEALILSQLRARRAEGGGENFILPIVSESWGASNVALAPWMSLKPLELFSAPVGVVSHVGSVDGDELFPAYSPQAQEEALDHIEVIAAVVNSQAREGPTPFLSVQSSSALLARVLDTVERSNAAGDPMIYGERRREAPAPLYSIFHLGLERGSEIAFHVDVLAIRPGERISAPGAPPLFSGSLFLKEYTVAVRKGPLAFEQMRVVDLLERAA